MSATDPTVISLILAGVLHLVVVGVILKGHRFREWAGGLLLLYVATSALWTLGRALSQLGWPGPLADQVPTRALLYGLPLLSLLFLHLNRSFLRLAGSGRNWWALGGAWIAAEIVLHENLLELPETMWISPGWTFGRGALAFGVLVAGWAIFTGGAALLTVGTYRRTQQPLHRNRIKYWSPALALTAVSAAVLLAGREPLASGLHLLGTLSATYAVLTYRLPDVRQMARQTLSYLLVTLLTVAIYSAGILASHAVFHSLPGYSPLLAGAMLALGVALLFGPLLDLVQRLVNRLTARARYDPSRTLREYSMQISNILDLERLATVVVDLIGEAMEVRRGVLFVVHHEDGAPGEDDGSRYHRLRDVVGAGEGPLCGELSADSPVVDYLRRERRPLTQYEVDLLPRFRENSVAERAWLASLDMDVYVPICAQGEWIGLLALGPKASGDRYFDDDLTLLSTLADQTAVALENARLFDDLKNRNVEIEQLNEELTAANRELARLDQAKSDFINIASHELRTPLTKVHGYTEVLGEMVAEGSLDSNIGWRLTQVAAKAVRRLEDIVDIMCDVSQLDTETLVLHPSVVSVDKIVRSAVDGWSAALEEREQTLGVEGLEDLPTIIADGERLVQVFSHLIQNAIKYTPDGGRIRITGRWLYKMMPPHDQRIEVVVADTGIGVAPDDLERIFDRFYRASDIMTHSTGETKFKGAGPGLGLTVARGIAEAHGGCIWAESPGHDEEMHPGSQFHVVLPVQPGDQEPTGLEGRIAAARADTVRLRMTV